MHPGPSWLFNNLKQISCCLSNAFPLFTLQLKGFGLPSTTIAFAVHPHTLSPTWPWPYSILQFCVNVIKISFCPFTKAPKSPPVCVGVDVGGSGCLCCFRGLFRWCILVSCGLRSMRLSPALANRMQHLLLSTSHRQLRSQ